MASNWTIETLTVAETTELLRSCGMRISVDTLRLGLQQGVYPFGVYVAAKGGPVYQIFAKQLEQWIADRAVPATE